MFGLDLLAIHLTIFHMSDNTMGSITLWVIQVQELFWRHTWVLKLLTKPLMTREGRRVTLTLVLKQALFIFLNDHIFCLLQIFGIEILAIGGRIGEFKWATAKVAH